MDALYLEHESADEVVVEFDRRGYRTKNKKRYTKPMICGMLRSEKYAGKQEHDGKLLDGNWPALRTLETHDRIQAIMDKNNLHRHRAAQNHAEYIYLIQGLLRCGGCGRKRTPKAGTGQSGKPYPYYVCTGADKSKGLDCGLKYVPARTLDNGVLAFLKELRLKPERLEAMAKTARASASDTIKRLKSDLERSRELLGTLGAKINRLTDGPALEPAHAIGFLSRLMPKTRKTENVAICLSGRGDKDLDTIKKVL
jgi:hypothetical protein